MQPGQPSHTAFRAAAHRAAHQTVERGRIFADPLAGVLLGEAGEGVFGDGLDAPATRNMRLFIAARSRFAEDSLAAAVAGGVRQYVVLGAGLDTFAWRNPFPDLRVFEVDHPLTQAWKRERLAKAGLAAPASLTFAPVDFERQTWPQGLAAAGFDAAAPAVFAWLGVVVYLTRETVMETLAFIATLPPGTQVVFDYGEPLSAYPEAQRAYHRRRLERMAAIGEPWITRFDPAELAAALRALGFDELEDLSLREIGRRYVGVETPEQPGAHLIRAARRGPA